MKFILKNGAIQNVDGKILFAADKVSIVPPPLDYSPYLVEILDARIEDEYANPPLLELRVCDLQNTPIMDETIPYQVLNDRWYFSEARGIVSYYAKVLRGDGYDGRSFRIQLEDGSQVTLKGPWRSSSINMNVLGFPLSIDCEISIGTIGDAFSMHAAATLELAHWAIRKMPKAVMVKVGEEYMIVERAKNETTKSVGTPLSKRDIHFLSSALVLAFGGWWNDAWDALSECSDDIWERVSGHMACPRAQTDTNFAATIRAILEENKDFDTRRHTSADKRWQEHNVEYQQDVLGVLTDSREI